MISNLNYKEARIGAIKYDELHEGLLPNENVIVFSTPSGKLTGLFNKSSINVKNQSINVSIIGEHESMFLIDLPTYTFTSGSRAWVLKKDVIFSKY